MGEVIFKEGMYILCYDPHPHLLEITSFIFGKNRKCISLASLCLCICVK